MALTRTGEEAGLTEAMHQHLLRHFAIARYLRADGDLKLTRRFARHCDVKTTAQLHPHVTQADVDAGMAKLPGNGNAAQVPNADPEAETLAARIAAMTPEQRSVLRALFCAD